MKTNTPKAGATRVPEAGQTPEMVKTPDSWCESDGDLRHAHTHKLS